jgi:hypothetical protein
MEIAPIRNTLLWGSLFNKTDISLNISAAELSSGSLFSAFSMNVEIN